MYHFCLLFLIVLCIHGAVFDSDYAKWKNVELIFDFSVINTSMQEQISSHHWELEHQL